MQGVAQQCYAAEVKEWNSEKVKHKPNSSFMAVS